MRNYTKPIAPQVAMARYSPLLGTIPRVPSDFSLQADCTSLSTWRLSHSPLSSLLLEPLNLALLAMSLLSTLRPLSSRLYDHFGWILSYLPFSGQKETTFDHLSDDAILLLLETLSLPQLLQLRAVSRRLCHLIEVYRLPQYRTLLYGYTTAETMGREDEQQRILLYGDKEAERRKRFVEQANLAPHQVQLHLSTHTHAYSEFNEPRRLTLCDHSSFFCRPRQLFPGKLTAFPLSLPSLLPRLTSLTFTNYLVDGEELPTEEEITVNRLLAHYLCSSWADSLVSLHLFLAVPSKPTPYYAFFNLLSKLSILKHFKLELSRYVAQKPTSRPLLPNRMPVLSQLTSFSLSKYGGRNTATLLAQLGPDLTYLSLWDVACSVKAYTAFLASKPTYSQTLKRVEILLHGRVHLRPDGTEFLNLDMRIFTRTAAHCLSLERAVIIFDSPEGDLASFFSNLKCLKHCREFSCVTLYLEQFRVFRLQANHLRRLPKFPAIRRVAIDLATRDAAFEESELTDTVLPLLARVFPNLDFLNLSFSKLRPMEEDGEAVSYPEYSEAHSLELLSWAHQHFKGLRECSAIYSL